MYKYNEFVFEDRILKLEKDMLKQPKHERIIGFLKPSYLESRLNNREQFYNNSLNIYEMFQEFFSKTENYNNNKINYCILSLNECDDQHFVVISNNSVIESFQLNKFPSFEFSKKEDEKTTVSILPVTKYGRDFELKLYGNLNIIPTVFENINIIYTFRCSASLGRFKSEFTEDIYKTRIGDDFFTFFGKPGKLYLRFFDALNLELFGLFNNPTNSDIFLSELEPISSCEIYDNQNSLVFNGCFSTIDNHFPLFLDGSDDGRRDNYFKPKMKNPRSIDDLIKTF